MSEVLVRPAVEADAEELARLHVEVWESAYRGLIPESILEERRASIDARIERWRTNVAAVPGRNHVAEHADAPGRLLGFVTVGPNRDDDLDHPELWALYADAAVWGTGVGHALLTAVLPPGPASLWVLQGNDRAIGFYQRHGFALDGVERSDEVGTELRMVREA